MLVRLRAEQISAMWPMYEYALWNSIPPGITPTQGFMTNTLAACLAGDLHCWLAFNKRSDGTREIMGVIITYIDKNECSGDRNLVIYSLYGYGKVPTRMWADGIETLRTFARGQGCSKVMAFTPHNNVMRIAQMLDCKSEVSVLEWEV